MVVVMVVQEVIGFEENWVWVVKLACKSLVPTPGYQQQLFAYANEKPVY